MRLPLYFGTLRRDAVHGNLLMVASRIGPTREEDKQVCRQAFVRRPSASPCRKPSGELLVELEGDPHAAAKRPVAEGVGGRKTSREEGAALTPAEGGEGRPAH